MRTGEKTLMEAPSALPLATTLVPAESSRKKSEITLPPLPDDIWVRIFAHLRDSSGTIWRSGRYDLLPLKLVDKRFKRLVEDKFQWKLYQALPERPIKIDLADKRAIVARGQPSSTSTQVIVKKSFFSFLSRKKKSSAKPAKPLNQINISISWLDDELSIMEKLKQIPDHFWVTRKAGCLYGEYFWKDQTGKIQHEAWDDSNVTLSDNFREFSSQYSGINLGWEPEHRAFDVSWVQK